MDWSERIAAALLLGGWLGLSRLVTEGYALVSLPVAMCAGLFIVLLLSVLLRVEVLARFAAAAAALGAVAVMALAVFVG